MAIVSRRPRRRDADPEDSESIMTAAAGGLKERFMRKVAGIAHGDKSSSSGSEDSSADENDVEKGEKLKRKKSRKVKRDRSEKSPRKRDRTNSNGQKKSPTSSNSSSGEATATSSSVQPSQAEEVKAQVEAEKKKKAFSYSAKLTQLEQTVPADAQIPADLVEKVSSHDIVGLKPAHSPGSFSKASKERLSVSSLWKTCSKN